MFLSFIIDNLIESSKHHHILIKQHFIRRLLLFHQIHSLSNQCMCQSINILIIIFLKIWHNFSSSGIKLRDCYKELLLLMELIDELQLMLDLSFKLLYLNINIFDFFINLKIQLIKVFIECVKSEFRINVLLHSCNLFIKVFFDQKFVDSWHDAIDLISKILDFISTCFFNQDCLNLLKVVDLSKLEHFLFKLKELISISLYKHTFNQTRNLNFCVSMLWITVLLIHS